MYRLLSASKRMYQTLQTFFWDNLKQKCPSANKLARGYAIEQQKREQEIPENSTVNTINYKCACAWVIASEGFSGRVR